MLYRKAAPEDAKELAVLRKRQLADEGEEALGDIDAELEMFFRDCLSDGSLIVWLAVEESGEIAATGAVCFHRYPPTYRNPTGMTAYVTGMYTAPGYRRKGLAKTLLGRVLDEARNRGCGLAQLHASVDGRPLYEAAGFVPMEGWLSLSLSS